MTEFDISKMVELFISELKEIHSIVNNILKKENPQLFQKIELEMLNIVKKYDLQKREILEKLQKK